MQTTLGTRHQQIETVVCDMDNTLFDLVGAKLEACRCVVDYLGAGDPEALFLQFLNGVYGFEDHRNIRDYLEALGVYQPRTFEVCCRTYEDVKLDLVEPYPGVEETLRCLQDAGIRLAVATDAESVQADRRLRKTGLIDFFEVVVTPEVSGRRKPEPGDDGGRQPKARYRTRAATWHGDRVCCLRRLAPEQGGGRCGRHRPCGVLRNPGPRGHPGPVVDRFTLFWWSRCAEDCRRTRKATREDAKGSNWEEIHGLRVFALNARGGIV